MTTSEPLTSTAGVQRVPLERMAPDLTEHSVAKNNDRHIGADRGVFEMAQEQLQPVNNLVCNHKHFGIVTSGVRVNGAPHAETKVCNRASCIENAKRWVKSITHLNPIVKINDGKSTKPQATQDDAATQTEMFS